MFKKILCPIDFSEFTKIQLEFARGLSRVENSHITALYVLRLPLDIYQMQSWDSVYDQLEKRMQESMKIYCEDDITPLISKSLDEAQEIVEVASTKQHDLILMPTHGYHGLEKVFLGSIFQGVLLKSHVPILALPRKFMAKGAEFRKPLNILCAIDLQEGSEKLVHFTEMLAQEFDATFSIVHSIDLQTELLPMLQEDQFREEKSVTKKKVLSDYQQARQAQKLIVTHGVAHENILSAVQDTVDLVVLGFSHKSKRRLRTTLYRVVAELDIPALCIAID